MAEYDLPWPPTSRPLQPLRRVSPSRAVALKECALREAWSAQSEPALLPTPPTARLGTAVHRLLKEAGAGRLSATASAVEHRLGELLTQQDEEARRSWLDRRFTPIADHIPDLEVRLIRAVERALEVAARAGGGTGTGGGRARTGYEVWVENRDRTAGGSIDEVRDDAGRITVADQKTGPILDRVSGTSTPLLKEAYVTQLKIYAALYHETWGVWPRRGLLIPLRGDPGEVGLDPFDCTRTLEAAIGAFDEVNRTIRNASRPEDAENLLANPSPTACRYCTYRPRCRPYVGARPPVTEREAWPADIWGAVTELKRLRNGTLHLTVDGIRLRGLFEAQHPALNALQVGNIIAAFNARRTRSPTTFDTGEFTAVYRGVAST